MRQTATLMLSTPILLPARWTGFYVVLTTTIAHLILVGVTTLLFLWQTWATYLGSVWQAVAQVSVSQNHIVRVQPGDTPQGHRRPLLAAT